MCLHIAENFECQIAAAFVDFRGAVDLQTVSNDTLTIAIFVVAVITVDHHLVVRLFVIFEIL